MAPSTINDETALSASPNYEEGVPDTVAPFKEFLVSYSGIPMSATDDHLLKIRDKAWAVAQYRCIGRWFFTNRRYANAKFFQDITAQLKDPDSTDVFLDVACCLGQVVRQLAADGVSPTKLRGIDLHSAFLDIGYELFQDRDRLPDSFLAVDLLDAEDTRASVLNGTITLVHVANFFHLFDWDDQIALAVRIVQFLRPGSAAKIFGGQIGNLEAGPISFSHGHPVRYIHNVSSLSKFWGEVGDRTGTRWTVRAAFATQEPTEVPGFPDTSRYLVFSLSRE